MGKLDYPTGKEKRDLHSGVYIVDFRVRWVYIDPYAWSGVYILV